MVIRSTCTTIPCRCPRRIRYGRKPKNPVSEDAPMKLWDRRELLIQASALAFGLRAFGVRALEAPAPTYPVQMQTLKYASPGGKDLLLDLYLPQGAPGPVPVVVFVHGGGWAGG